MKKLTEKGFQRTLIQFARIRGWRVVHVPRVTIRRRGKNVHLTAISGDGVGFPDLLLCRGDRILFAELKVGKNPTTAQQDDWILDLRRAGQTVYLWRPTDRSEIEKVLS